MIREKTRTQVKLKFKETQLKVGLFTTRYEKDPLWVKR